MKTPLRATLARFCFTAAVVCLTAGCHPAPTAPIRLPSTVPLQKTLTATRQTQARVQQLADEAAATGLRPGSADAQTLKLDVAQEGSQLARMQQQVDALTAQLLAAQKDVAAVEQDRDAQKARADSAEEARDLYKAESRERFWIIVAQAILGILVVSLLGAQLQTVLRALEKFAAKEALAAGTAVVHAAEAIPKVAALAAVL